MTIVDDAYDIATAQERCGLLRHGYPADVVDDLLFGLLVELGACGGVVAGVGLRQLLLDLLLDGCSGAGILAIIHIVIG